MYSNFQRNPHTNTHKHAAKYWNRRAIIYNCQLRKNEVKYFSKSLRRSFPIA